ncbi:MAG: phosphate ABC transporter substrate-binding protein PstS family protein [Acidimicrobiales bacterium]
MKRRSAFLSGLLALSVVAAACGGDDAADTSSGTSAAAGAEGSSTTAAAAEKLTGEINISGSSTVEPISQRVKELFNDEQPDVAITVAGPGTGDGFKAFCAGETDISNASRPIKAEEAAACKTSGVEYVELKVAFDGLTVVTDPKNSAVECLNMNDLYALVGPESQGFKKWSDAQAIATELGSKTKLPDAALSITAPGAESGTYDSFIEIATEPVAKKRVEAAKLAKGSEKTIRKDYNPSADDNVIIKNIEGTANSLGWVGFAFASEQGDKIKSIAVDSGKGCVKPSAATIADATYPLSRGLYVYVNTKRAAENPALVGYVNYYLDAGYAAVEEVGYVALPDAELAKTAASWTAVAG